MASLENTCEQAINHSTNWIEVYSHLIHLGITDPLFHAENFCRLPIELLKAVSENLIKQKQQTINADSIAVAKLACLVYGALGGKKNSINLESFLPFAKIKASNNLQDSTIDALKWAIKNEKLPMAIVGMIGSELA